jgi:autotransporter-associated beta strand protein
MPIREEKMDLTGMTLVVDGLEVGGVDLAAELAVLGGITATAAELNYLDISTLGTGADSKAVVLSSSGAYAFPASTNITAASGADFTFASGTTVDIAGTFEIANVGMTASAAELNYLDIGTLGTGADSKAVVLDSGGAYAFPASTNITAASGADFTFASGTTVDIAGTFEIANVAMTATAAQLNVNAGVTAGTLAAGKAWTSDANLDTTMPTGGLLTVSSGAVVDFASGSTLDVAGTFEIANVAMTATAAQLNFNVVTAGTLAASTTWTSDSSLDTVMPTGGLLTVQSGGAVTLNSGATLTNNATGVRTAQATEHGAGAIGTSSFGAPQTRRWTDAGVIVTQTKFDLTGLISGGTANDIVGLAAGGAAFIGRNVVATNGVIFKMELSCLESPATGDTDIDIIADASAVLAGDGSYTGAIKINGGTLVVGQSFQNLVPAVDADYYFYIAAVGAGGGTYTAGMFILTTYGHAVL